MGESSAFSKDGKYYSCISQDGRLRIWDTESNILKQEYTPDLHLTSPPSCLQWINVGISSTSPQKGAKRKSVSEEQCIALGTTSGKILIYSVTQAKIENVLKDVKHGGPHNIFITSIDWHRNHGLFSCNKSSYVYYWDLSTGGVRNKYNVIFDSKNKQANSVSAIKIVPHNLTTPAIFLITASWQVCLWRLHNGSASIMRKLGHNATPQALLTVATYKKNSFLIEGSQNERLLSFWDVTITEDLMPQVNGEGTPSKKQRKNSTANAIQGTPTYNFVLEDAPRFIDVVLKEEENCTSLKIAAATRSGVCHYYGHTLNGSSTKPIKPSVTIQVTTQEAQPLSAQCCKLLDTDILLGYSSGPLITFEKVIPDFKSKTQILIRGDGKESKKKTKQNVNNEATKTRSESATGVTYVEPMGGKVSRKRVTPGGEVEVPMEARLQNLALDPKSRSKSAVNQNYTKLLMQGLHSKDKDIIHTVLYKNDSVVATRTVSALPADYVPMLLERLVDMASSKTIHCASVCTWTWAVLKCHSALLLAASSSKTANHLSQLLTVFTHRRSHLCQLLNLKGRLELTMSQRSARDQLDEQEAVLQYNDTSTDDEMEIEKHHSDSDQSWEDDMDGEKSNGEHSDGERLEDDKSESGKSADIVTDSGQSDDD